MNTENTNKTYYTVYPKDMEKTIAQFLEIEEFPFQLKLLGWTIYTEDEEGNASLLGKNGFWKDVVWDKKKTIAQFLGIEIKEGTSFEILENGDIICDESYNCGKIYSENHEGKWGRICKSGYLQSSPWNENDLCYYGDTKKLLLKIYL